MLIYKRRTQILFWRSLSLALLLLVVVVSSRCFFFFCKKHGRESDTQSPLHPLFCVCVCRSLLHCVVGSDVGQMSEGYRIHEYCKILLSYACLHALGNAWLLEQLHLSLLSCCCCCLSIFHKQTRCTKKKTGRSKVHLRRTKTRKKKKKRLAAADVQTSCEIA